MSCSPARLLANQANAKRSTGPRTEAGKARSRANALKHGLTGQGVVLPEGDAAEVARRSEVLQAELAPSGLMGRVMVDRIARLSVRLERCGEEESASIRKSARHARDDYDEERQLEVVALFEGLGDRPATSARKLLRTPEGVDATIRAWLDLKADLARSNAARWTAAHCERANNLTGRRMGEIPTSRIDELSRAIWGDFGLLDDHEGAGLDDKARQVWAGGRLAELIDEEVEALRECRESLDLEAFDLDREEAGQRAGFDPSKQAILARRYEAAAERGMFRALGEFRKVEAEAANRPEPAAPRPVGPLGSFFPAAEPPPEEDIRALIEAEERLYREAGMAFPPSYRPISPDIDQDRPAKCRPSNPSAPIRDVD